MKTKLLVLSILMLTAHCAYSQHIQVEGTDTLAVVPIDQIRNANILFLQSDSLQAELKEAKILIIKKDSAINTGYQIGLVLQKKNNQKDQRISTLTSTIVAKDKATKKVKLKAFVNGCEVGVALSLIARLLIFLL